MGVFDKTEAEKEAAMEQDQQQPRFVIQTPGMRGDSQVGLGDAIKKATKAVGIEPCSPCQKRANALNLLVAFRGRK